MSTQRAAARVSVPRSDRLARGAEAALRLAGDARVGLALLLIAGAANAVAAGLPEGPRALDSAPYAALLGAIVLSGMAGVAVRAPVAWREWRRPSAPGEGPDALTAIVPRADVPDAAARARLARALRSAGYRVAERSGPGPWALYATLRGWSRVAGVLTHLALVLMIVGVAIGAAFGHESTFSLVPGEQAFLDDPRPGFADAVRLETFDAEFGADDRPRRLDTVVTFLRAGEEVERTTLQVNAPGSFGGYLVHPWTYGPAVELRVTTLGGRPLLDEAVPLADDAGGRPFGTVELPGTGSTLGLVLLDAERNELAVTVAGSDGIVDTWRLAPGEEARIGGLRVRLTGFSAWVTFLSRSDPGIGLLFGGAGLLVVGLAASFWLPRRRISLRWTDAGLRLVLRGERFERPVAELDRLRSILGNVP